MAPRERGEVGSRLVDSGTVYMGRRREDRRKQERSNAKMRGGDEGLLTATKRRNTFKFFLNQNLPS